MARIELERSGGFAGLRLRAEVDTAEEPDSGWYADQLAGLDLPALAAAGPGEPKPDRFCYALSVAGDDGTSQRIEFGEADLPDALRPLVDRLEARARRT